MIDVIFQFGTEVIMVRVLNKEILFKTSAFGGGFVSIEGLKLSRIGTIKQFPNLKDRDDWRTEAIKMYKLNLNKMESETQRMNYVIEELRKHGYKGLYWQDEGFRRKKF